MPSATGKSTRRAADAKHTHESEAASSLRQKYQWLRSLKLLISPTMRILPGSALASAVLTSSEAWLTLSGAAAPPLGDAWPLAPRARGGGTRSELKGSLPITERSSLP